MSSDDSSQPPHQSRQWETGLLLLVMDTGTWGRVMLKRGAALVGRHEMDEQEDAVNEGCVQRADLIRLRRHVALWEIDLLRKEVQERMGVLNASPAVKEALRVMGGPAALHVELGIGPTPDISLPDDEWAAQLSDVCELPMRACGDLCRQLANLMELLEYPERFL